ncbi:nicotinamide mononucleotide transporter [Patescibacteria group bacterium]
MQITLDLIAQVGLTILSVSAIILVAKKNKWGFVVGLISQPFWFITSLANEQWGVFITSIIFTFSWIFGIYNWFFKKKDQKELPERHHH